MSPTILYTHSASSAPVHQKILFINSNSTFIWASTTSYSRLKVRAQTSPHFRHPLGCHQTSVAISLPTPNSYMQLAGPRVLHAGGQPQR